MVLGYPNERGATRAGEIPRRLESRLATLADASFAERWATAEEATAAPAVEATLDYLRRTSGVVEPRAGHRADRLAGRPSCRPRRCDRGARRDRRRSRRVGRRPDRTRRRGYATALEIGDPRISVPRGHAWEGSANVGVVEDERALDELVIAGLVRWCTPMIEALDPQARVRRPLWAQVADSLGPIAGMLADSDPGSDPLRWVERVERLLAVSPVPWRQIPALWTADAGERPLPVYRRGSCCLYYRSEEPEGELELDADFLQRFGNEAPQYCGTCRLRAPEDVEARTVYWALRARAAQSSVQ